MEEIAVLVIDPDQAIRELLGDILREEGCDVTGARSLEEASSLLSTTHFDLIITEAFGQEELFDFDPAYIEKLKALAINTPMILSSTYPSTDTLRAGEFGFAEIVPKPFEIEQLLGKIDRALGRGKPVADRRK